MIKKWNSEERIYEPYIVPEDWKICLYTNDFEKEINCCQCGKKTTYGDCYTSLEVHNDFGLGFAVCDECYEKEWERRRKQENKNEDNN